MYIQMLICALFYLTEFRIQYWFLHYDTEIEEVGVIDCILQMFHRFLLYGRAEQMTGGFQYLLAQRGCI